MTPEDLVAHSFIWDDHGGFETLPDADFAPLLAPWRAAGVNYLSICAGIDPRPWDRTLANIAALRRRLEEEVPYTRITGSVAEIDAAHEAGKMAITFDIEGMEALDGRPDMVQLYYDLGVRHMNFAYNLNNRAGSGCHDEDTGITPFGIAVIREMNRAGMIVDCTHTGYRTTMAAMEHSTAPVSFTHSNPRALVDHGRNIHDDQIRAAAATGGLIGINGINHFLGQEISTPQAVSEHVAYVADMVGTEHVAIALDYAPGLGAGEDAGDQAVYDGLLAETPQYWPASEGYDRQIKCLNPADLPLVVAALRQRGFSDAELIAILGGNNRRLAEMVWK